MRFGARSGYLMRNTLPFETKLGYLPLAPKDCLSMEVGRRHLPLAYKKSCVVFLLNNVTLRYPPLTPKDLFFMEVTDVTCLRHKHFLIFGLRQESDCNISSVINNISRRWNHHQSSFTLYWYTIYWKNTLHIPSDRWQIYIKLSNSEVDLLKTV